MGVTIATHRADIVFQVDGGATDKLRVAGYSGVESLSMPFKFRLELASTAHTEDLSGYLGKPGLLTIPGIAGKRYVNGVISRFEQVWRGVKFTTYEADLVPTLALLAYRYRSRIFQNSTVKDIVTAVLKEGGVAADRFKFSLNGTYTPWEYCVQYRESDLAFVSRLLEEEGIFYLFEHKSDGHVLVMGDNPSVFSSIAGQKELYYTPPSEGMDPTEEHVLGFRMSHEVRPGKVTLREYNPLKPSLDLTVTESADRDADREVYEYPGDYEEKSDGQALAKIRLAEERATRALGRGDASCRNMMAGYKFDLKDFPRGDFNTEYLIVRVHHEGVQPHVREADSTTAKGTAYKNQFECIPGGTAFRPDRVTPRPYIPGAQTALVVGPKGEKVYMDERGRAKVRFYWDRDDKDPGGQKIQDEGRSCWVRVSQGYAGPTHGIQFPPLVGDEVVVEFLEGDPDRPLITGRVYNEVNKPPLKPDDRIQNVFLTPYQHKLLLDDKKQSITLSTGGSAEIHLGDPDEDKDFGSNVKVGTKDGHFIQLAKGEKHKGMIVKTQGKHTVEMRDDPDPGIFIVDGDGKLVIQLDTKNQTINLVNDNSKEINILCKGGTINVKAADIKLDAENGIYLKSKSSIEMETMKMKMEGKQEMKLKAPMTSIAADAKLDMKGTMTTLEGAATMKMKGGAMVSVEGGAMAELKGGGMTSISGGLVKIN